MRLRALIGFLAVAMLGTALLLHHGPDGASAPIAPKEAVRVVAAFQDASASQLKACQNFYRTVCHKRGPSRDFTGEVDPDFEGELQALRIYEEIVRAQPSWTLDQVDDELVKRIYTPDAKTKVTSAYLWVKNAINKWIDEQPAPVFSDSERKKLHARIRSTKLELPGPASVYDDERELFTKNDVFYERVSDGTLRMRVGGAFLLNVRSWFNLVFTISHEFGHAIDPCEIRAAGMALPAYDRLSACFLRTGLVGFKEERRECMQNDQLSEAFADWLAVKITARALEQYASRVKGTQLLSAATNAVRDLCDPDEESGKTDSEFHPSPAVRIERIFGANPEIRQLLSCPVEPLRQVASVGAATEAYCELSP